MDHATSETGRASDLGESRYDCVVQALVSLGSPWSKNSKQVELKEP